MLSQQRRSCCSALVALGSCPRWIHSQNFRECKYEVNYQQIPLGCGQLWGPRLVQGPEWDFLEHTETPPTYSNELLEGTWTILEDPGNPRRCDLPPPAARAINCVLGVADPCKGPGHNNSHWDRREGEPPPVLVSPTR